MVGVVVWLKRRRWYVGGAALVIVGVVAVVVWPSSGPYVPPVRARVLSSTQACLLTDAQGVSSAMAAPVWAGMKDAQAQTSEMVTFLAVAGPQTEQNVQTYVNTLATRQCDVVVAVGALEVRGVLARASAFSGQRFVVVADVAQEANVVVVPPGSAASVEAAIRRVLVSG